MQHLRRAFHRDLRPLHQGRLRESPLRKMFPVQRLLPVRTAADSKLVARLLLALALAWTTMLPAAPNIQVHGHRGARAMRPENTLPAFRYAIDAGVDVLELDMAVTRDNVVVVSHDPYLEPPVCSGPRPKATIHELTLEEVRQWDCGKIQNPKFPKQTPIPGTRMPTLDEVFDLAPRGKFQFNIETKIFADHPGLAPPPDEFARLVLAVVRKHKLEQRVILQSFDFRTLVAMKKLAPEIRLSALWEREGDRDFVSIAKEAGAGIISPMFPLVTPEKVRAAHAAGLEVVPWTANTPAEWDKLIAAQVDAIISDDPAELIAYLKNKRLR
jgi:glycerophosphoryl diester phosphodiesterase